jgi:phosphoribosyl 1,2-cyclic phosphodiesterase
MSCEVTFCPLYSSSSGNVSILSYRNKTILIDAGVSYKKLKEALDAIGFCGTIDAILLSHDHSDHTSAAGIYFRKLKVPIYTNQRTWKAIEYSVGCVDKGMVNIIETGDSIEIGAINIETFHIPHDGVDPMGFCFHAGNKKISISTDLGFVAPHIVKKISHSDVILLESNHDVRMLMNGPYPPSLKQRIISNHGHLSNEQAADMIMKLNLERTQRIYLGHMSAENNKPELAMRTVKYLLKQKGVLDSFNPALIVAEKYRPSFCSIL